MRMSEAGAAARLKKLTRLYREIHRCEVCVGAAGCHVSKDPGRVVRRVIANGVQSRVFLVGQALGSQTQRKSGIPYCRPNGSLSPAGQKLDDFLRRFGYSIDPASTEQYVYSSDVVQHYTGRAKRGDRKPTRAEIENCSAWLDEELTLIRPRVAILLGTVAAKAFLSRYCGSRIGKMDSAWGKRFDCVINNRNVSVFPLRHPSYRFGDQDRIRRIYAETGKRVFTLLRGRRARPVPERHC